ncbi:MAG: hypothetical protein ACRDYA_22920 [Egibacteraceae bacterium]
MLLADVTRAALVMTVPLLYLLELLDLRWLFVLAFVLGAFQMLCDSASLSFVPQLVGRERLARANGSLQASQSAADLGGPVLAAWGAARSGHRRRMPSSNRPRLVGLGRSPAG